MLIWKYLSIPVLFSLLVAIYAMSTGKHNQANFFGLVAYSIFFYGLPYFLFAILAALSKASSHLVHAGYIGISLALFFIAGMWLLPADPSGLPIQWMGYWPLTLILGLASIGGSVAIRKIKNS